MLTCLVLPVTPYLADGGQAASHPKWSDTADLGVVATTGNTQSTNLALSNKLKLQWGRSDLEFHVSALRVQTTKSSVLANFDDPANPHLDVNQVSETTSAHYESRLTFNQKIHDRLGWFSLLSWERNRPAGYDQRSSVGAGLSYTFPEHKGQLLRFEAGLSAISNNPVNGDTTNDLGARQAARFERDLTESVRLATFLEALENIRDSSDFRAHLDTSVSVTLNHRFALKIGYQVRYDHQPEKKVYTNPSPELGPDLVFFFDTTSTVFSTSLVAKF